MPDTNILFSALLFPVSLPAQVLFYVTKNHNLVLCDYIISELQGVVSRKRPDLLADIDVLFAELSFELIPTPREPGKLIPDPKDHPILNAAIVADIDIVISGDKHFLELKMEHPQTMSAREFFETYVASCSA